MGRFFSIVLETQETKKAPVTPPDFVTRLNYNVTDNQNKWKRPQIK